MDLLEILTDLGIDAEVAQKAVKNINKEIPTEFIPKEQYNKKVIALEKANEATKEITDKLTIAEEYKTKVATLEEEYKNYKQTVEDGKALSDKQSIVREQLKKDGANPKLIKLLEKEIDYSKITVEDGKVQNWEEITKPLKTEYAEVFGTTETKGADTGNPPSGKTDTEPKDLKSALYDKFKTE